MLEVTTEYIIVGAGLSGLTSAYSLQKNREINFLVLESKEQVGGRIYTTNSGVDLGATWFQSNHKYVIDMINDLNIERFNQYDAGKSILVYNSMEPAHYFEKDTSLPSAYRIAGGSLALINALKNKLDGKIKTNTFVSEIIETKEGVSIKTENTIYKAKKVIITIPPRLTNFISFTPSLPKSILTVMKNTHTWMSNAIKVGLTFRTPFWRQKGLSGTLISQVSVVTELYDHTNASENGFSLMGFVNEGLRDKDPKERKESVLGYLEKYLGSEIQEYLIYEEKDWSKDKNTSMGEIGSKYTSLQYGDNEFQKDYFNRKLLFSGTETSIVNGGYMDGAIYSGIAAVQKILKEDM